MLKAMSKKATLMVVVMKSPSGMLLISRKNLEEVVSLLKPSFMEKLVNISKAPLDDVETLSESHEMVTVISPTMCGGVYSRVPR